MVTIGPEPAALSSADLSLFYAQDDLLGNCPVLIFYGPTATSTQATHSRIQAHVFTPAGLQNFARLIISPTATFYNAVTCLPREEQGDEICRGLAFSLFKYYVELPPEVKRIWEQQHCSMGRLPAAPRLFSESHAAMVAARMVKVENVAEIITDVRHALGEQTLSWLDLDVVLPQGAIKPPQPSSDNDPFDDDDDDAAQQRYGSYASIVKLFGESSFLPTSKLRRAPSKPTAINRSQAFSRNQKENLRREMCELLDTEENYVSKLYDLVHSVAVDFRKKAKHKSFSSTSPSEQALKGLFPPSLDQILEVNSGFLEEIRAVLEETENDAIQDIESTVDDLYAPPPRGQAEVPDVTGAVSLANALLEWFPKFTDCYTEYTTAHADFSQLLKVFMKDTGSSFSKRVYDTGEQRLMSMLIEPVQRLPRYNLYIDNIVKQLPLRHPALKLFLKARDLISEICARDAPSSQQAKALERIRKMVFTWPPTFTPRGRLINAIDFIELSPPYHGDLHGSGTSPGVFLLFSDFLVILKKPPGCTITARSIMSELDNQKAEGPSIPAELIFHHQLKLADVFLSEHSEGNILQLLSPAPNWSQPGRPRSGDRQSHVIRMFYLQGPYEGKAHRIVEDVVKARVEGRYPESEREGPKWEVRCASGELSLFSAVTEDLCGHDVEGRKEPAKVQVHVEPTKLRRPPSVGEQGVELTIAISKLDGEFFLMETSGINGYAARDKLSHSEFLPVLRKRLGNFFQLRNHVKNPALTDAYLMRNLQVLKSLSLQVEEMVEDQEGKLRSPSPVKLLSNLFGGSVRGESPRKLQRHQQTSSLSDLARMAPPLQPTRTHSRDGEVSRPTSSSNRSIGFNANASSTSLAGSNKLEETLTSLVLALHARKGNIVGRSVRARTVADEASVNELYNALVENPANIEIAAQASVDVLFAAFDKFLNVGWKEKMGSVLSHPYLVSLQQKSDSMYPGEFEDFFRTTFEDLTLQNQRALRQIIRLLADLLDGTSNDGDRGILTAAFAEMLVPEGMHAIEYISLMDRFVQDIEALFNTPNTGRSSPMYGSVDSKSRAGAAGSLTSNTSLRKRFGFGNLTRENSKSEAESKVGSIWRSLSKNNHGTDSSTIKGNASVNSLGRSNSIDAGTTLTPKRPNSRDRPTILGAFSFEGTLNGPSPTSRSYLGAPLGTVEEVPKPRPGIHRRRSSLNDLKIEKPADNVVVWAPQTPRPERRKRDSIEEPQTPKTPVSASARPTGIPTTPGTLKLITNQSSPEETRKLSKGTTPSPTKGSHLPTPTPTLLASPFRKENSPANTLERGARRPRSNTKTGLDLKDGTVTIKASSPTKRRSDSISSIPLLKPPSLSERPTSMIGNSMKFPPPSTPRSPAKSTALPTPSLQSTSGVSANTPRKLRMQSPQKLRERLQVQEREIENASIALQSELSSIGQDLSAQRTPRLVPSGPKTPSPTTNSTASAKALELRMSAFEKQLKATLETLQERTAAIGKDVESSLQVSETRAKQLDKLYRETNAENEILYQRFNDELDKIQRSVRQGRGMEEVDKRMREMEQQNVVLRKENARLKREVAGLRAQIRE